MSRPRYGWWGYVLNMISRYPALQEAYRENMRQSVTPNYTAMPHGNEAQRKTENTVMKAMSKNNMREYEAVTQAISDTEREPAGAAKMQIIRLVYWRRTHTIEGAAQVVHVSYATARAWHRSFVYKVADAFGLMD